MAKMILPAWRRRLALHKVPNLNRQLATIADKDEPEQSDFMSHFIRHNKTAQSESYEPVPFYSRHLIDQTGENKFFGDTVRTATTVPRLLAMRRKGFQTPESAPRPTHEATSLKLATSPPELLCLLSLGPGLASHPNIVHGGFQCVIFDEVIRLLILLHNDNICTPGPRDTHFTVSMTTSYAAPVPASSDILVRSWLTGREGRKWWANAEIVNSEGQVSTTAEAMWVTAKNTIH
ncbi:unnamed protein product [Clonostachys rosea]|uniref:Thioesterase domain-containing protein n=1 Tax=Bionectria ochroleuca TaxID=29856 RepID=A0ABY6UVK2_BIOOC|nr:unnamed protein product [Clonostachys rosea]